jgi:hypothetical protein
MKVAQNRNLKLNELTKQQVHQMSLATLRSNLELSSAGEKSSADNVLDILQYCSVKPISG